jgi:hypothetical protein
MPQMELVHLQRLDLYVAAFAAAGRACAALAPRRERWPRPPQWGDNVLPPKNRALPSKRWSPGRARGWRAVEALLPLKRVRAGVMAVAALLQAHRPAAPSPRKAMQGFSRGGAATLSCCMFLVEAVGRCDARGLHGTGVSTPQQMTRRKMRKSQFFCWTALLSPGTQHHTPMPSCLVSQRASACY